MANTFYSGKRPFNCLLLYQIHNNAETRWLTKQAPSHNTAPNPDGFTYIPSACAIRTATINTGSCIRIAMRGHLALARIGDSFPLEVPIDVAALHEITDHGALVE